MYCSRDGLDERPLTIASTFSSLSSKPMSNRGAIFHRPDRWKGDPELEVPLTRGFAALALLVLAGCGSSSGTAGASPTGGVQATAAQASPSSNKGFQVSTANGQVSVSLSGALPPNWPTSFPVPQGATPAGSGSLVGATAGVKVAVYGTSASPADTFDYYKSNPQLTTSGARSVGAGSTYLGSLKVTAPYSGSVTVVSRNNSTYIVIVLTGGTASPSS
jgi:hypothetical protein